MLQSGPAPPPDPTTLHAYGERKHTCMEYAPVTEVELEIFTFIIKVLIKNNIAFSVKKK